MKVTTVSSAIQAAAVGMHKPVTETWISLSCEYMQAMMILVMVEAVVVAVVVVVVVAAVAAAAAAAAVVVAVGRAMKKHRQHEQLQEPSHQKDTAENTAKAAVIIPATWGPRHRDRSTARTA